MKVLRLAATYLLVATISSCNTEEILLQQGSGNDDATMITNGTLTEKITPIGGKTIYEVDPKIMAYFKHYCQTTATGLDGTKACGPTSYMMASYCLAKYKDNKTLYTCNNTKLQQIVSITGVSTSLSDLQKYGNNQDKSFIVCSSLSSSDRAVAKTNMQKALTNDKFVIVGVNMFGTWNRVNNDKLYLNSSSNPDLSPTLEASSTYITTNKYGVYQKDTPKSSCRGLKLITTSGVYGHIIVILKITVNNIDGTGVVEYIDPIADSKSKNISNRRYMSYTRLLESMKINGCYDAYDAISVGLK